eukprot:3969566-Prymnesium_polylepis.1
MIGGGQRTPFPANGKGMASEVLWGAGAGKVTEGCSGGGSKARVAWRWSHWPFKNTVLIRPFKHNLTRSRRPPVSCLTLKFAAANRSVLNTQALRAPRLLVQRRRRPD